MDELILTDLNPAQQTAVRFEGGPLMILAGAGSGKTRVLTYRVAYLVGEQKINPDQILLLTFTNKAAQEMMKRVKQLVGSTGVVGGTFHSFAVRVLRRYGHEIGLDPNFVIFDTDDQVDVIKSAMQRIGVDPKTFKPNSVHSVISNAKNELITPADYAGFARGDWQQIAARVYMAYQQLLRQYKALDFDDLLTEMVKLLGQEKIRDLLQGRFTHILVDEYQDTNKAQYLISKILAMNSRNLTVVGDAAQSIYSWRGADYKNMLMLRQDFPDLTTMNLEQNYRSTQNILGAANSVIAKNKNHPVLKLWTANLDGEKITLYEAEHESDEARYVVNQVLSAQYSHSTSSGQAVLNYSEFAILYRTNAQSRVFEEMLLHVGIPYTLIGGVRFYERKEIKDALAYLQLIVNPDNEIALKRAERIGKTRLARLQASKVWSAGDKPQIPTLELLDEVLKVTGYLELYDPHDEEDAARLENIKELRSVAEEFGDLLVFLENIALTEKESKKAINYEHGAVTLMTLHAAKGLEFNTVFLVGMEEGLFPHSRTLMNPDEMEEERRLAYVGITRAREKLYMTYARRRLYFGMRSNNPISRFVAEIPEELLEIRQATGDGFNPPSSRRASGLRRENWGFGEDGNFNWKPDDEV